MLPKIGFIGLGVMGKPMTLNLLKAGYPVMIFNRSRAAMEALQTKGAELAKSVTELTESAEVLIGVCFRSKPHQKELVRFRGQQCFWGKGYSRCG
jgi:2-hydroxy-3-oxopropionate reductase